MQDDTNNAMMKYHSPILNQFEINVKPVSPERFVSLEQLNAALGLKHTNARGEAIRFVPQAQLTQNYEQCIFETGHVPTRANHWHDYYNAHVWLNYPQTKAMINALQYHSLKRRQFKGPRTGIENALTLFDENGALVLCSDPELIKLLLAHQWQGLFYQHRERVLASMRVIVIGHSLHEKARSPYIGMTAHCHILEHPAPFELDCALIDEWLSGALQADTMALKPRCWSPLPILGYPGWHYAEQNQNFYANEQYFRSKSR